MWKILAPLFNRRTNTENHMIEQKIEALTAALIENTAALLGKPGLTGASTGKAPGKGATQAAPAAAAPAAGTPTPAGQVATAAPDLNTVVTPKVLESVKKAGHEKTVAILNTFKTATGTPAQKGSQVQPGDYAALVEKLQAAIDAAGATSLV